MELARDCSLTCVLHFSENCPPLGWASAVLFLKCILVVSL